MSYFKNDPRKKRYYLIDDLRGLAVINMVAFHFLFDLFIIYGKDPDWYSGTWTTVWQQLICQTFILISGFSFKWGRKNSLKRGLFLNIFGLAVTFATLIIEPDEVVWFGILNFYGCAVWLMVPLDKVLKKVQPHLGFLAALILFILFRNVQYGCLSWFGLFKLELPRFLYNCYVLTPFGFMYPGFFSSDYFPVLPWFFLFTCGYFLNTMFESSEKAKKVFSFRIPVLDWIGRKAIWIYLAHQPICWGLCYFLFNIMKL